MLGDKTSPMLYGLDQNAMGVLFNVGPLFGPGPAVPVVSADAGGRGARAPGGGSLAPMGAPPKLTTLDGGDGCLRQTRSGFRRRQSAAVSAARVAVDPGAGFGRGGRGGAAGTVPRPPARTSA